MADVRLGRWTFRKEWILRYHDKNSKRLKAVWWWQSTVKPATIRAKQVVLYTWKFREYLLSNQAVRVGTFLIGIRK
jgi:hypothetical protein